MRVHPPSFPQIQVCHLFCVPQLAKLQHGKIVFSTIVLITPLHTFPRFSADSSFSPGKISFHNHRHNNQASVGVAARSSFATKTDHNCMYLLFFVSSTSSGLGHLPLDSLWLTSSAKTPFLFSILLNLLLPFCVWNIMWNWGQCRGWKRQICSLKSGKGSN